MIGSVITYFITLCRVLAAFCQHLLNEYCIVLCYCYPMNLVLAKVICTCVSIGCIFAIWNVVEVIERQQWFIVVSAFSRLKFSSNLYVIFYVIFYLLDINVLCSNVLCNAPPLIGGGIERCFCLTSVWGLTSVAYIVLSPRGWVRESPRGLGRPKLAQRWPTSHVTPLSGSKGQGHQAALLTAMLARQVAAAVGTRMCWPWETAATLPFARRRKVLRHPWGG